MNKVHLFMSWMKKKIFINSLAGDLRKGKWKIKINFNSLQKHL